jgi:putative membrane protein
LIAILVLAGALLIENMATARTINGEDARNLARVDAVYGLSAALVLLCGLTLWFWIGKPAAFYSGNPLFHLKVGLFVLIGLLSVYPTRFYLRHRKSTAEQISVPRPLIWVLRTEIGLLLLLPVLAVLMARGIGLSA